MSEEINNITGTQRRIGDKRLITTLKRMVTVEIELNQHAIEKLKNNTLHKLGFDASLPIDPKIERTLDEALLLMGRRVRPKGIYRILPVLKASSDGVQTEAGTIRSANFTRLVKMCGASRLIVFMVATVGKELEEYHINRESIFNRLLFHTVGSELTESVANMVEREWRRMVESFNLQCSRRFSPGYCDWELEGQSVIFKSLEADQIDVRLTPHLVMIPSKSISGVAIAASKVPFSVPCALCGIKGCQWRSLPPREEAMRQGNVESMRLMHTQP